MLQKSEDLYSFDYTRIVSGIGINLSLSRARSTPYRLDRSHLKSIIL